MNDIEKAIKLLETELPISSGGVRVMTPVTRAYDLLVASQSCRPELERQCREAEQPTGDVGELVAELNAEALHLAAKGYGIAEDVMTAAAAKLEEQRERISVLQGWDQCAKERIE